MKKLQTTFFLFVLTNSLIAQINTRTGGATNVLANSPTTNTNVGIGTNTPKSKLDVEGGVSIGTTYSGTSTSPLNGAIIEGNVGIGTITPTVKLDVNGNFKALQGAFVKSVSNGTVFSNYVDEYKAVNVLSAGTIVNPTDESKTLNFFDFQSTPTRPNPLIWFSLQNRNDKARFVFTANQDSNAKLRLLNKDEEDIFSVSDDITSTTLSLNKPNSFLGIGTTSFIDGSETYRLSVKGNIRAHELKVYTTWADYVFHKDYNLVSLPDVELFIKKNGHLSNIPSAKEVETNGILLGEMNKKLLEKVEELTLYLIQQNKEIEELKVTVKTLIEKNK